MQQIGAARRVLHSRPRGPMLVPVLRQDALRCLRRTHNNAGMPQQCYQVVSNARQRCAKWPDTRCTRRADKTGPCLPSSTRSALLRAAISNTSSNERKESSLRTSSFSHTPWEEEEQGGWNTEQSGRSKWGSTGGKRARKAGELNALQQTSLLSHQVVVRADQDAEHTIAAAAGARGMGKCIGDRQRSWRRAGGGGRQGQERLPHCRA